MTARVKLNYGLNLNCRTSVTNTLDKLSLKRTEAFPVRQRGQVNTFSIGKEMTEEILTGKSNAVF